MIEALIRFVLFVVVLGLIFYLFWWLLQQVGLPEPFDKLARVGLALLAVIILLALLLGLLGHPALVF